MSHHPFHIVDLSPWPLTASMGALSLTVSMCLMFQTKIMTPLVLSMMLILITSYLWWRDISREGAYLGFHSMPVMKGLKIGMILFIVSEVMFFLSFFWAFFHSSLSPSIQIGVSWPPLGINSFDPTLIPLLNTSILISSGVTITWAHNSLINFDMKKTKLAMWLTIILGVYFSILQAWEYMEAPFSIADSVYGSTFFVSTGFHGLHVLIGTSFLSIVLIRSYMNQFSPSHHIGFEAAAWYWHFVDVVWLFLYSSIYWWGN